MTVLSETWVTVIGKKVSLPWKDLSPVQQRKAFIDEYLKQQDSVSELCRRFAVSRKTAYKWIQRFLAGCELVDRSRRPHNSPTATAAALEEAIVAARKARPRLSLIAQLWSPNRAVVELNPRSFQTLGSSDPKRCLRIE